MAELITTKTIVEGATPKENIEKKMESWEPTHFLRWARHELPSHKLLVLEQLWINIWSDASEWREIPTEDIHAPQN